MLTVRKLVWDEWTVSHIARHGVTPEEAVEVCFGEPVVLEGHSGRLLILGPTVAKRMLTVVVDPQGEEGIYFMVTARPAARKERRIYQAERGGERHAENH